MTQRLLISLDDSHYFKRILSWVEYLQNRQPAALVPLAPVDTSAIAWEAAGAGIGFAHYAGTFEEEEMKEAQQRADATLQRFQNEVSKPELIRQTKVLQGTPWSSLVNESGLGDLLLVGMKTWYRHPLGDKGDHTLERLAQYSRCPVLAIPDQDLTENHPVLIAYDGESRSQNAVRAFVQFLESYHLDWPLMIMALGDDMELARQHQQECLEYLSDHQRKAEVCVQIGSKRDAVTDDETRCAQHPGQMIVLGTHGHDHFSDYFFGAALDKLIEDDRSPLFIYH